MTQPDAESAEQVAEYRDETGAQDRRFLQAHEAHEELWAVLQAAKEAERAIARDLGLSYNDALALDHVLTAAEKLGPVELGRRLGITSASATVMVKRLVASGHLHRRPDPADGRRRILKATEKASRDIIEAKAPLLDALDSIAASLDGTAAAVVISYLRDVADVYQGYSTTARRRPP